MNLFSQLCNNKNECQQNNVKHRERLKPGVASFNKKMLKADEHDSLMTQQAAASYDAHQLPASTRSNDFVSEEV